MLGLIRKMNGRIYIRSLVTYSIDSLAFDAAKALWKAGHAVHVEKGDDGFWSVWHTI